MLYRRGLKAYFKLRRCLGINFRDYGKLSLGLFDALIKPILLYGIGLWSCLKQGFSDRIPIEKLKILSSVSIFSG